MRDSTDRTGPRLVLAVAASLFLLEWIPSFRGPYGYFIDELYYLACAIELFGRGRGLPPVYASQNTCYLWGPREEPVEVIGMHDCEWCMPWRDETQVLVVRGQKVLFRDAWPAFKHYE